MMRALWTALISVLCALMWYRQHLKFLDGRGIFHAISPEQGDRLLLAAVLLAWGTALVIAWREVSAGQGTGKPGLDRDDEK